jgi:peptidoglycan/xylan/chitin deacetylase (PgdA/CDA1 family)
MKKFNFRFFFVLLLCFISLQVFGISFGGLNLSDDNRVLFYAEEPGAFIRQTFFVSRLSNMALQQITAFPEKLKLVDNNRSLLAVSRFGAVKLPVSGGLPSPVPGLPSFASGTIQHGRITNDVAASADGRWVLYLEPTGPAYGNLVLVETSSGSRHLITSRIELPSSQFPALWSLDSRLFVYAKGGKLYYFPMIYNLSAMVGERYRTIGDGVIANVMWGERGEFYYISDNVLYRVRSPELFTRTIYADFLSIGTVIGRFPVSFDRGLDRFWVSPDGNSVLILKDGKNLLLFPINSGNFDNLTLPHVLIPSGILDINVLWSAGQLTAVVSTYGENNILAWRFEINGNTVQTSVPQAVPASVQGVLSPDGTKAVFWGGSGLVLWDYVNWKPVRTLRSEPVFSCVWINNNEVIAGGGRLIERLNISGNELRDRRQVICLSGADDFGFEDTGNLLNIISSLSAPDRAADPARILVKTGEEWFVTDGTTPWAQITGGAVPRMRRISRISERYRVYLEDQTSGPYENLPMIRNVFSVGTVPLLPAISSVPAVPPGETLYVGLCFDLYDDDTGVAQVLDALRRYDIKATFFMNGDFIRNYPSAAAAIVNDGHEAASLFYAPIDFSDTRYDVNTRFITQGLARNEDEFFKATGRELKLLWHPPFFRTSAMVTAAASSVGYRTINRDLDSGDWLGREDMRRLNLTETSASDLIELIIRERSQGAVIPVRLGVLAGGRDDYLFFRIERLIEALTSAGCIIVPVSMLSAK